MNNDKLEPVTGLNSENEKIQSAPLDPRGVCNLILNLSGNIPITNLALQKLLYFCHGLHLAETKLPLVTGYFEAWQYGPVHPAAYKAFKLAGNQPITFRAASRNALTGELSHIPEILDDAIVSKVRRVAATYGALTPGRLVDISHAVDAPWHYIVQKARNSTAFGMRIPDKVIEDRFNKHKIAVGLFPLVGEPGEDTPFA